jgi:hypothetical protein
MRATILRHRRAHDRAIAGKDRFSANRLVVADGLEPPTLSV